MAHHIVPNFMREVSNKSKIAIHNCKEFRSFTNYMWKDSGSPEKSQYMQGKAGNLSPRMALHKKASCCGVNIATWAQEYFRKPLPFTTVCCCIKKCNLNICYSRRKLYINYMQRCCQSSSQIAKKTVEMCAVLRWVHISTCFRIWPQPYHPAAQDWLPTEAKQGCAWSVPG